MQLDLDDYEKAVVSVAARIYAVELAVQANKGAKTFDVSSAAEEAVEDAVCLVNEALEAVKIYREESRRLDPEENQGVLF